MEILSTVESRWKNVKKKNKALHSLADIHQDLVKRMLMYSPSFKPATLTNEEIEKKWVEGDYLLHGIEDQIDFSYAIPLFRELVNWNGVGKSKRPLKNLEKSVTDQTIKDVLLASLRNDDTLLWKLSEQYQVDIPLLAVLVQYSLLPTLSEYSKAWTDCPDIEEWGRGYCPVCGSYPILSEYRESEKFRFLRCGACASDWQFQRLQCASCHNTNHEQLNFLYTEDEKNKYRIDVCDSCHTYVKGVNALNRQAYPLLLFEEMSSVHLDLIAQEKGYQRC